MPGVPPVEGEAPDDEVARSSSARTSRVRGFVDRVEPAEDLDLAADRRPAEEDDPAAASARPWEVGPRPPRRGRLDPQDPPLPDRGDVAVGQGGDLLGREAEGSPVHPPLPAAVEGLDVGLNPILADGANTE